MTVSDGMPLVHYAGRSPSNPASPLSAVRRVTIRECARLQTFPGHRWFAGTKAKRFWQVCNAVPVRLAEHVAGHLREAVFEQSEESKRPIVGISPA